LAGYFLGAPLALLGCCLVTTVGLALAAVTISSWLASGEAFRFALAEPLALVGVVLIFGGAFLFHCCKALEGFRWRTLLVFKLPARPPPARAWQVQSRGRDTVIVADRAAKPVAYFSELLEEKKSAARPLGRTWSGSAAHPSGRTWAGAVGNYVCLFTLEGNPLTPFAAPLKPGEEGGDARP
jgi:hypothetical protein